MNELNLHIQSHVTIPAYEMVFTASRSSGPGGQHVNKTSSRITLHWSIIDTRALSEFQKKRVLTHLSSRINQEGILLIHVDESRSQYKNKEIAKERLKGLLLEALRVSKKRQATKPTKASKRRRVDEKKKRGLVKNLRKKPMED